MKDLMELVEDCKEEYLPWVDKKNGEVVDELRELGFIKATEEAHKENLRRKKIYDIGEHGYVVITEDKIRKFLQRKVKIYNLEHEEKEGKKPNTDYGFGLFNTMNNLMGLQHYYECRDDALEGGIESQQRKMGDAIALSEFRTSVQRMTSMHETCTMGRREGVGSSIYEETCDYLKTSGIGKFEWTEVPVEEYESLPPREVIEGFKKHKERKVFDYFTIAKVNAVPDPVLLGRINEDKDRRWFLEQWSNDICLDDLI